MKKRKQTLCALLLLIAGGASAAPGDPADLRCEHLTAPLGIDAPAPRLSWRMDDDRQGAAQRACRITVGTDSAAVAAGRGGLWDSGRMETDRMLVRYGGAPLQPFTRCYWRITLWDHEGVPHDSPVAVFETGMMQTGNWQGSWIGDNRDIHYKPAPYFRKEFTAGRPIRSARAYIAAAGLYELYLNGERVGDHRLDPLYTRYDRRNLYVTYDVTRQLREGANAVGVLLGNGWYNHQSGAVWNFERARG
ncbi:secreted protein containing Bacterial alpha-L-rhamnosidase, partial [human gut metagenome]